MLVKRSMSLSGHRTSIALEQGFWDELDRIAKEQSLSRAALIAAVDATRAPDSNLASALRLLVLNDVKAGNTAN